MIAFAPWEFKWVNPKSRSLSISQQGRACERVARGAVSAVHYWRASVGRLHLSNLDQNFGHSRNRSSNSLSRVAFDSRGLLPSMNHKRVKVWIAVERLQIGVFVHPQSDPNGQAVIHR